MECYEIRHFHDLRRGDHLCGIYSDDNEQRANVVTFILDGLVANDLILWVEDNMETRELVCKDLKAKGVDHKALISKGQLVIAHSAESYLKQGFFEPTAMIEQFNELQKTAVKRGYTKLRVTAEPAWILLKKNQGEHNFVEYESTINNFFKCTPCLALCSYNTTRWSSSYLHDILTTHPQTLIGGELFQNFYYVPPEEFFSADVASVMLKRKITNLVQRKRVEEELIEAKENAVAASNAKSRFLATVSHEIRTPLTGILGMTEELLSKATLSEDKDCLEIIRASGDHLLTVINEVLESSRIESGKVVLECCPFDLFGCVKEAINICKPQAMAKQISIIESIQMDVPQTVEGDVTRLRQVLVNLIGNAVKFTRKGTVEVHVSRTLSKDNHLLLRFRIIDQGIGIPKGRFEAIFSGFTQANLSTTRLYGGTGLGLSISKQLVELWNGEISVESEEGVGSTFSFSLPTRETKVQESHPPTLQIKRTKTIRDINVLLAEDNPTNQKVADRMLNRLGCSYTIVSNGQEAVDQALLGKYDIICMDLFMPVLDGWEATKRIRESGIKVKILALTASMVADVDKSKNEALFDAILTKPLSAQTLKDALELYSNT